MPLQMLRLLFFVTCGVATLLLVAPNTWFGMNTWQYNDKLIHWLTFAMVTVTGGFAYYSLRVWLWVIIACMGVSTELVQIFVPGRQFSLTDMGANVIGLGVGVLVASLLVPLVGRRFPVLLKGVK